MQSLLIFKDILVLCAAILTSAGIIYAFLLKFGHQIKEALYGKIEKDVNNVYSRLRSIEARLEQKEMLEELKKVYDDYKTDDTIPVDDYKRFQRMYREYHEKGYNSDGDFYKSEIDKKKVV